MPFLLDTTARSTTTAAAGRRRSFAIGDTLLQIEVPTDGMVKVRRSPLAATAGETPSPAVVAAPAPALDDAPAWREEGARQVLRTPLLTVELHTGTGLLTFRGPDGGVLLAESAVEAGAGDGTSPQRLACRMRPEEQFYGLGQKVRGPDDTSLGWRGRVRSFGPFGNVREKSCPGVAGQGNGNTSIPLLVSSLGFGLFLDNHYRHDWDFTGDREWRWEADRGEHRYWFLYGPDAAGVLERYTALTGRPPMPPRWALGLLQSKFGYRSWDEVHAVAERYRESGVPCDTIILDLYWFGGVPHFGGANRIGALAWDEASFPDAAANIARLRALGFKVVLIEEPYVDDALPAHGEAARLGHLATDPDGRPTTLEKWWGRGGIVDMSSAAAREWWWRRHAALLDQGVAGWWTDLGEPDTFDAASRYAGGAHADVHNLYALDWARALAEGYARDLPGARPFVLTRAGYAGIQRHGAALWSNDVMTAFEWLAPQVATGLNMGLSGVPYWGTDVGGFIGPVASDELYVRWFQFGAFSPIFRPHGQDRPTAPFEFSDAALAICRRYAELRYRLLPYLYSAAREAHASGLPLMRPLALEWPDDRNAVDLGSEYLFGPALLVAPMLREGTTRNVYLPAGRWTDFWTHEVYTGPTWLRDFPAPLDTCPLFVREGSILPLGPAVSHADERANDELTLRVYPGPQPTGYALYEDDGASTAYLDGEFAWTPILQRPTPDGVVVDVTPTEGGFAGQPRERRVTVEVACRERPRAAWWNGSSLPAAAPDGDGTGWWWDAWRSTAVLRAPRVGVGMAQRFEVAR
jgi:alpha-glucosidase (family GH31 glycosyl hydrolase)